MLQLLHLPNAAWSRNAELGVQLFGAPGADDRHTRWTHTSIADYQTSRVDVRVWFRHSEDMTHFALVMER
jgi:hypothetical protein